MKKYLADMLNSPDLLEGSQKKISNFYLFVNIVLIFFTPILLYIELVSNGFYQGYITAFSFLDRFIILFFTIDLVLRIYAAEKKFKYFLKKVKMNTKVIGNKMKNCSHNEIAQKCSKGIKNSFCQNIINFE